VSNLFKIAVIIPTYNPSLKNLELALTGLKNQDLPLTEWECIIVDNASTNGVIQLADTAWHPNLKVVKEARPGLTFARLKGFEECRAEIIVFVDDDNVLNPDYLSTGISLFSEHPKLGVAGGKTVGSFETDHDEWLKEFYGLVAVRTPDVEEVISNSLSGGYPAICPIGAGMLVTSTCFNHYYQSIKNSNKVIQDRTGTNLSSGGDNEINIIALKTGFDIGYFSRLSLVHLIDKGRLEISYLKKLNYASSRSWIKLLHAHQICPWKPISTFSLPFRKAKAFVNYRPWSHPANAIKYSGACGMFKGLSEVI
jgi:glycosyltransferase involved in cell wall biosynthesis